MKAKRKIKNAKAPSIVHHQTIVVATVKRKPDEIRCKDLSKFLSDLVKEIKMNALFDPIAIHGKFGFTGIVGIVTSHIAFHYFDDGRTLHFDVYSCKKYSLRALMNFLNRYWRIEQADVLFIKRDEGLSEERFTFENNMFGCGVNPYCGSCSLTRGLESEKVAPCRAKCESSSPGPSGDVQERQPQPTPVDEESGCGVPTAMSRGKQL